MASESRKRPAEPDEQESQSKRQRLASSPQPIFSVGAIGSSPYSSQLITTDELAKCGLRRSLALALQKVGFDAAAPEALESFVTMTETYLSSLVEDIRTFSNAARRSHPVPRDFENTIKRFNLSTSALKPHRKPPIPKSKREPSWEPLVIDDPITGDLPILGHDLDGSADKASRDYIPSSFPAFPSIHTYKCTPETIETAADPEDWSSSFAESQSQTLVDGSQGRPRSQRPLAPDEIPRGDPKKMREAAAKEAKAGEQALRRLMRASKIAKQKEVSTTAQRDPARRERYTLWEAAMRELVEEDAKGKGKEIAPAAMHSQQGRVEIADHSMIVNANKQYHRREIPRSGARKVASDGIIGKG